MKKILLIVLSVLLAASIFLNGWLMYDILGDFPPENYNPWIKPDPKMMCTLINSIDDAKLREPACNSHSDICTWSDNKCVAK